MIELQNWFNLAKFKIIDGYEYRWDCFGPHAYAIGAGDESQWELQVVFDTSTQEVYIAEIFDLKNDRAYRIYNPEYRDSYFECAKTYNVEPNLAWDNVLFVELETDDDFINKARAVIDGIVYDTRIEVPLELSTSEQLQLFKLAHAADMTVNQYVEKVLLEYLNKYDNP